MHPTKRRGRVAPSGGGGGAASPGDRAWSPHDKACLERVLDPLHRTFGWQPLGFLRSEASTMLCLPPGDIYERLTSMLTNASIVSGLVLSAIAGAALNPLDADDYPGLRRRVEWYNAVAAVTVATQLCVVLYSTFSLFILTSNAHSPSATYRSLVHMARWIGFLEFMTFVPAMGCFAQGRERARNG